MSRARLLGAAACAATAMAAPPTAAAAGADTLDGGCLVVAADVDSLTNFVTQGLLVDASAAQDGAGDPNAATVTCWMRVNGFEASGTRFTTKTTSYRSGRRSLRLRCATPIPSSCASTGSPRRRPSSSSVRYGRSAELKGQR